MFKQLLEFVRQALFLQHDVARLKEDVKDLETRLHETNDAVRQLAFEIQRIGERERHEREKFMLKIENVLLRFERLLPPGTDSKKGK